MRETEMKKRLCPLTYDPERAQTGQLGLYCAGSACDLWRSVETEKNEESQGYCAAVVS
jgi:hypothetical protein